MTRKTEKITKRDIITLCILFLIVFVFYFNKLDFTYIRDTFSFLFNLNLQNYNNSTAPIFLSIGEALSSITILFAIYQYKEEKWRIALKIKKYIGPVVFFSITAGIILSIISSIIVYENPNNIFELSIFWQIFSSILIAFSIMFLFIKTNNKNLFNKGNARMFYEVITWELSRPNPDRLEIVLNTILDNFDCICKSASIDDGSEMHNLSVSVLDSILGEDVLVELITTKRLDALHFILAIIQKNNIRQQEARGFLRIIRNLFADQNSFLYKQYEFNGLAISFNIYDHLFGSSDILKNFNLFSYEVFGFGMNINLNQKHINVVIKSLSKSIETYLKTGQVPARHINDGLRYLSDIFHNLCQKVNCKLDKNFYQNYSIDEDWWSLHIIAEFIGHDYVFLAYRDTLNENIVGKEKETAEASFNSNFSINAGIAAILYKSFESLSLIKKDIDVHLILNSLSHGLFYEQKYKEGYIKPFEKRMWNQIGKNVINRIYPATLRTYLASLAYFLTGSIENRTGWIHEQTERMRQLLYIDLKPIIDSGGKMIDEKLLMKDILLPKYIEYKNNKFIYISEFGKGNEIIINEPNSKKSE